MRRKPLIIGMIVLVLLFTIVLAFVFQNKNPSDKTESEYTATKVKTIGLDPLLAKIPGISLEVINTSILGAIRKNIEAPKSAYDANYREGSFQQVQTPTKETIYSFLVDIPEVQRSFLIQVQKSPGAESLTIYTLCPLPGQSAYGEKDCNVTP